MDNALTKLTENNVENANNLNAVGGEQDNFYKLILRIQGKLEIIVSSRFRKAGEVSCGSVRETH